MDPLTIGMVAAPIIGGISSALGQTSANRANRQLAREQMAFQERMSSTSWQRGVADMRSAGLNPMLAFQQGGASSPVGSSAQMQNVVPDAARTASSAVEAAMVRKQMKLLDMQVNLTGQQAMKAGAEAQVANRASQWDARKFEFYFDQNGRPKEQFRRVLEAEFGQNLATSARSLSEAQLAALSVPERKAIADLFRVSGGAGKGLQLLLPLLSSLFRR